jgi:putative transposase
VAEEVEECIRIFSLQQKSEIIVLSVQVDHVHLLVLIPPKISVSKFIEIVKGRTAIRVLNKFRNLRQQPYWGNRFWTRGYCVDTVGLDTEMIRKYVKYQDGREK